MKWVHNIIIVFSLFLGLSVTSLKAEDEATLTEAEVSPAMEESTPTMEKETDDSAISSKEIFVGNPEFSRRLTENLASKMRNVDRLKLRDYLNSNKNFLRSLAVWKITHDVDPKVFSEIAQTSEGLIFLHHFLRDSEWMEHLLSSGPVVNLPLVIQHLAAIYRIDPNCASTNKDALVYKKLATAVALEFARSNIMDTQSVLDRYSFYQSSHKYERLNSVFDELDWWEMRLVAGCKPDNEWGSVASLTWLRDNVRLPAQDYVAGPWQVPYRLENYFGDSIHGSDYYRPFKNIYTNVALRSREVGAVCGGLSHYGTFAALANGVPAMTMGEPGHCAMTVRINKNEWQASNSVSYPRSAHFTFFGHEWSMLMLTQTIMSQSDLVMKVARQCRAAELATLDNNLDIARDVYMVALKIQPLNYGLWEEYLDWEKGQDALDARAWCNINETVCKIFAKDYSEVCLRLLNAKVYPMLFSKQETVAQKIKEVEKYHKVAHKLNVFENDKSRERIPWKMGKALTTTYELMGEDPKKKELMMKMLIANQLADSDFSGDALAWCQKLIEDDPAQMEKFFDDITRVISLSNKKQKNALFALADACMGTAQKNMDVQGFQSVGNMMKRHFPKNALPEYKKFSGDNLSRGGLVVFSSIPEINEDIWKNWGVLEKNGGAYKSGKKPKDPTATVLLPSMARVSGVVLIGTTIPPLPGQKEVLDGLIVECSEDGINWVPLGKVIQNKTVTRLDVQGSPAKNNRCKYVRLTREGTGDWGVSAIHIFGTRLS